MSNPKITERQAMYNKLAKDRVNYDFDYLRRSARHNGEPICEGQCFRNGNLTLLDDGKCTRCSYGHKREE